MKQRVVTRRARKQRKLQDQRQQQAVQPAPAVGAVGAAATSSSPASAPPTGLARAEDATGVALSTEQEQEQGHDKMHAPQSVDIAASNVHPSGMTASRPIEIDSVRGTPFPRSNSATYGYTPETDGDAGDEYDWLEDGTPEGPSALNGASYSSSFSSLVTGSLGWFLRPSPGHAKPAAPAVVAPMAELDEAEWERSSKSVLLAPEKVQKDELDFAEMVYGA